ncbi:MAG: MBL fold metallo-hydrolase [Spirochaetes bacterium]|nr:MBL fold metallo-hydrolase [Spirochaetota bacterium]
MFQKLKEITIKKSEKNMTIKFLFPSGLEIYGFATENNYGGDWDYGATWNYLVMTDRPFLVDTGRFDMGGKLIRMIEDSGISRQTIEYIVICHGHEDHDGGLYETALLTGRPVLAHETYRRLVGFYPELAPPEVNKNFPASCWHCFMPESFPEQHCLKYHRERALLKISGIGDGSALDEDIIIHHVPGHSPDSIAIQIGDEAILVGDTVLPEITPFPSMESFFQQVPRL